MRSDLGPILVTGTTGQVGGELLHTLAPLGEIVAPTRLQLDLARPASIRTLMRSVRPRWIVNPAAYTAVDKAESELVVAYTINHMAVEVIGEEARALGAAVLHFSTDYVFSGTGTAPLHETDLTGPCGVYGASKLAGEQALAATGAAHLILRTSWVYGATGKNFLRTILKAARERPLLRVVDDQYGAPTSSRDLARLVPALLMHCEDRAFSAQLPLGEALAELSGVYHATASGETTWFGFASEILRLAREREPATPFAALEPIATREYPTPARRPFNSRLDNGKLAASFGQRLPPWRSTLREIVRDIAV